MNTNSKSLLIAAFAALSLWSGNILAQHGGGHQGSSQKPEVVGEDEKISLQIINERYLKSVKPIFEAKCFSCHATTNVPLPWYSKIPFVKGMIQSDVTEAKEHLDMTSDFPFNGHGTAIEDLTTIRTEIEKGEMPPARYWMIHWDSRVTKEELTRIREWTLFGEAELKKPFENNEKHVK